jgi:hypothetical protein
MAGKDPKKRQEKLMKQRRKAKARQKKQVALRTGSHGILQKARQFPLFDCQISADWKSDMGLVQVLIARQQPDGKIVYGLYLIDKFCLGLKNTSYNANISVEAYRRDVVRGVQRTAPMMSCSPELAHQFIYEAIDYAAQFGFKPQKDYKWSRLILEKRGTLEEPHHLTFGKDGKPFYISGPYDNPQAIIAKLEKTAGPGNYDYLLQVGGPSFDDDFLPFDDEDEAADEEPGEEDNPDRDA